MEHVRDVSVDEHIGGLAEELAEILEKYLPEDHEVAKPFMLKARRIRLEMQSLGFPVKWTAELNPKTRKLKVTVRVWKPKDWLSDEDEAIFQKWLIEAKAEYQKFCEENPE